MDSKKTKKIYNDVECGKRLRECRKKTGLTQEDLASELTKLTDNKDKTRSPVHIGYLENGKRSISLELAHLLASVLKVRPEYLLGYDDYETDDEYRFATIVEKEKYDASLRAQERHKFHTIQDLLTVLGYKFVESDSSIQFAEYNNNIHFIDHNYKVLSYFFSDDEIISAISRRLESLIVEDEKNANYYSRELKYRIPKDNNITEKMTIHEFLEKYEITHSYESNKSSDCWKRQEDRQNTVKNIYVENPGGYIVARCTHSSKENLYNELYSLINLVLNSFFERNQLDIREKRYNTIQDIVNREMECEKQCDDILHGIQQHEDHDYIEEAEQED